VDVSARSSKSNREAYMPPQAALLLGPSHGSVRAVGGAGLQLLVGWGQ
jgi:hypothetical protein